MTLVELVITIVIIGIAAAALFSAMASITARSADPMLRQQSLYIAEAYLETLLVVDLTNNPPLISSVDAPPRGINNDEPISELSGYRVTVTRDDSAKLGPSGEQVDATRIDVSVKDPSGQTLTLTGYRTNY
ncbi:MAG: prepilin-type cleavage/methylation domain-containing protein [Pseudomonas stutzeri]|nr:prepilin-type cleavage/methylation domain-containing protein [Stutzerimonas stutzeri]